MARERHLSRAPITEALIDIRVKLPADKQDPTLIKAFTQEIQKEFPGQFPREKELQDIQMMFEVGPPPRQETKSSHIGYRYDSNDGKRVIQGLAAAHELLSPSTVLLGSNLRRLISSSKRQNFRNDLHPLPTTQWLSA